MPPPSTVRQRYFPPFSRKSIETAKGAHASTTATTAANNTAIFFCFDDIDGIEIPTYY